MRVATAGGAGTQQAANVREWLAPLIRQEALPHLLQQVVPGFDLSAVDWQPVHPRAFARAVKPTLIFTALVTLVAALLIGWGAIGVLILMLLWGVISTRQYVAHLGWAEGDEVVMMRSGWIWQQITLARVNKIQAVAMHQTPFDRRAAMARVRVDTAGAGEFSHRVDIPYLDHQIASGLSPASVGGCREHRLPVVNRPRSRTNVARRRITSSLARLTQQLRALRIRVSHLEQALKAANRKREKLSPIADRRDRAESEARNICDCVSLRTARSLGILPYFDWPCVSRSLAAEDDATMATSGDDMNERLVRVEEKVDALSDKVDTLSDKVDTLSDKFDGLTIQFEKVREDIQKLGEGYEDGLRRASPRQINEHEPAVGREMVTARSCDQGSRQTNHSTRAAAQVATIACRVACGSNYGNASNVGTRRFFPRIPSPPVPKPQIHKLPSVRTAAERRLPR